MLATPCCYRGANKGLIYILYFTLAYSFTLTITHCIHGISNIEVLTSNKRMSAITIFSLYFNEDQNATGPSL